MLLRLTSARRVLHLPTMLLAITALAIAGAVAMLSTEVSLESAAMAGFALIVAGLTVSEVKRIDVDGLELRVTSLRGTEHMSLERAALGVRTQHGSKGHTSYTLYVFDGERELELASSSSASGSERQRQRLSALLFPDGAPRAAADPARAVIAEREQTYRDQQAQAQQAVDAYYASGRFRQAGLIVVGIVVVYSIAMGAYVYLAGR
jgi:hypothetical protein